MGDSTSKQNILKKIQKALTNSVPLPFPQSERDSPLYPPPTEELAVLFAEVFTTLQGKFVYCENEINAIEKINTLIALKDWAKIYCSHPKWDVIFSNTISLSSCDASITACEYLVARTGSLLLSSAEQEGRTASVYAPVHICIAYTSQILYDVKDALIALKEKYGNAIPSFITFATGPSRTADIEKTLVTGVHGPKEVYLFLVDDTQE